VRACKAAHEASEAGAEAIEMRLSHEKNNLRTCHVESRNVVLG
jgi:hypothetical protein